MIFGSRHVNNDIKFCIDREEIEKVYETKFLGVYIDYRLNWKTKIVKLKVISCFIDKFYNSIFKKKPSFH